MFGFEMKSKLRRLSIKDVCSPGMFVYWRQGRGFNADVQSFCCKKLFENYDVSVRTGGGLFEAVRTFCEQGEFGNFVWTSFIDSP